MSSSNKIHPIYVALDANQYSRAIKLCLAMPQDHLLAQALLAHAYNKNLQRYKSILVLQSILGTDGFQELQLECKYSKEAWDIQQSAAANNNSNASAASKVAPAASKKGKKGKKKPAAAPALAPVPTENAVAEEETLSLAEHLSSPPGVDENWEKLPPVENAITDETTLGTLVITLQNLKLFLTSYQLYCWASSKTGVDLFLRKAFLHGMGVVVAPQYCHTAIAKDVLANMQVLALQLARIHQQSPGSASRLSTSWVAQTALWQLKLIGDDNCVSLIDSSSAKEEQQKKDQQRQALLPRLAENLASKCCAGDPVVDGELVSARREVYFLYLRTLEHQNKWQEMIDLLQSDVFKASEETGVSLAPKQQVFEKQAECLQKLKRFKDARNAFEELLKDYPDNYFYWKGHLECSLAEHGNDNEGGYSYTEDFVKHILEKTKDEKYPQRGPRLIVVELKIRRMESLAERKDLSEEIVEQAMKAIMTYGEMFGTQVSCAFTDLESHLNAILQHCNADHVSKTLQWLKGMRGCPESEDAKVLRGQHRNYIFSVKMTHTILAKHPDLLPSWLPDWKDLVSTWKKTHSSDEPIQKECLPGDDLILLAIQQILRGDPGMAEFFLAAVLIEAGIEASPSNANLKIAALDIYSQLGAPKRSWEIYQELQIKHIQLDTCTYLILPILQAGGYYQEILKVSKGLLMLQTSVVREACEFMGRAMDNGILSKADEFMIFQREKMTHSLAAMEASGLMMDSAPFFAHDTKDASIGVAHGIVGSDSDFERATNMVFEVRNPYGALSLLARTLGAKTFDDVSDNRDFSVLSYEVLYRRKIATRDDIINDSLRRGHNHNLLISAALCVHYTKGPKKGKLVKPGEELRKACAVFLAGIESASKFCATAANPVYSELLGAQLELCRALLVANSGTGLDEVEDSLDAREKQSIIHLKASLALMNKACVESTFLEGTTDAAFVCQLLPTSVVPLFAICRMCAEIFDVFGWGKRKLKTKQVSAEFAKFATEFSVFVKAMQAAFSSEKLPDDRALFDDIVPNLIDEGVLAQAQSWVAGGRQETQDRVRSHLEEMSSYLDIFEATGDTL